MNHLNIDPSSLMPTDHIITIDRTTPFDSGAFNTFMDKDFIVDHEDPESLAVTTIDLSQVVIKHTIDTNENLGTLNKIYSETIDQIKREGGVLLDAKVLQTLIANPTSIPVGWITYSDSEGVNTCAIEFLGTTFKKLHTEEKYHLALSFSRGVWDYGYQSAVYSEEELNTFKKYSPNVRRAAAVLMPKV